MTHRTYPNRSLRSLHAPRTAAALIACVLGLGACQAKNTIGEEPQETGNGGAPGATGGTGAQQPAGGVGGNGGNGGTRDKVYFSAGINGEADGLFGSIQAVPEPGAVALLLAVFVPGITLARRRKQL